MKRRHFLATCSLPLVGCDQARELEGSFAGVSLERGHLLRQPAALSAPNQVHRTRVVIVGAGVAGLAAGRALRLHRMQDFAILELEDQVGGNSRALQIAGLPCPMGAHYLPVPGDNVPHVQDLLEELGLRQRVAGRWVNDERHLCHSPQERLFFQGSWQEGLLPLRGVRASTLDQYRQFSSLVEHLRKLSPWAIPVTGQHPSPTQLQLDDVTFERWLTQQGLDDPHLRWYLDYCCRDDYGASQGQVSAWAGIHYFASRHGFHLPNDGNDGDGLFTWPQGNAWLTQAIAAPLQEQIATGYVVRRIVQTRAGVEVDALHVATGQTHRWLAQRCIVALPATVAARVVQSPPDWVTQRTVSLRHAPWVVANVHIRSPLQDRPGAPASWDNVIYDTAPDASLGYVDATHQSLHPVPGATVLTWYHALGLSPQTRVLLAERPWTYWRDVVLSDLSRPHPDLRDKATHMRITRYGHAMPVPVPGSLAQLIPRFTNNGLRAGRLHFAHSDWAGYSVFEEAFTLGHQAGIAALVT